jgi:integrase
MAKRRTKGEGSLWYDSQNDRWMAKITLPNKKRRTKSGKNKNDVLNWLTDQRSKINKGTYVTDENVKLGDFITSYMEDIAKHNLRPKTFSAHNGYVKNHIVPELGHINLNALRPDQVQAFYTRKLESGLAPRTVKYIHSILHKTLDQALRWGLVSRNVTNLVDTPKVVPKAPEVWDAEQIMTFLNAVKDHPYYPIYVTAVYTGMRQGEVLGIHVKDVDLENGVIHVRQQVQWINGTGFVIMDVKTEKSKRPVDLPEAALEVLREHLKGVEDGLVFTASTGNPVYSSCLYRHFKRTIKKIGLPDIRFHDLRHAHATLLLKAGVHPKVVQERLGHSQISTTLDIYSHTVPSMGKEAAEKFDKALGDV